MSRIPSLDGLRALSIGLVLLGHLSGTGGFPTVDLVIDYSNLGVRVFFVISGFLITKLLMDERASAGRIDLRAFYLRRFFRIFPAYYALIGVVVLMAGLGVWTIAAPDVIHAVTYTTNYFADRGWNLGHTWSLAVEEQFYLLWPVVFSLSGNRRGVVACLIWIAIAPVCRVVLLALPEGTTFLQQNVGFSFETVSDAIATGCLLALMRHRLFEWKWYRALHTPGGVALVLFVAVASASLDSLSRFVPQQVDFLLTAAHAAAGVTILNACIAIMIDWSVRLRSGLVSSTLNSRLFVFVGGLSYSLYLWQQPFLNRQSEAFYAQFPQNLALTFGAALCSFYLIESPILRYGRRLSKGLGSIRRSAHPANKESLLDRASSVGSVARTRDTASIATARADGGPP